MVLPTFRMSLSHLAEKVVSLAVSVAKQQKALYVCVCRFQGWNSGHEAFAARSLTHLAITLDVVLNVFGFVFKKSPIFLTQDTALGLRKSEGTLENEILPACKPLSSQYSGVCEMPPTSVQITVVSVQCPLLSS